MESTRQPELSLREQHVEAERDRLVHVYSLLLNFKMSLMKAVRTDDYRQSTGSRDLKDIMAEYPEGWASRFRTQARIQNFIELGQRLGIFEDGTGEKFIAKNTVGSAIDLVSDFLSSLESDYGVVVAMQQTRSYVAETARLARGGALESSWKPV